MTIKERIKTSKSMAGIIKMINNDQNLLKYIINKTNHLIDVSIHERIFNIKNDIFKIEKCHICNENKLEWNNKLKFYKHTCSNHSCKKIYLKINKDPHKEELRRQKISSTQKNKTVQEKQNIINKIKKTNIEKYGKDSYTKTDDFKKNMIAKYGYISAFELKETHERSKKTILERYGCDHNFKIEYVKENKKKTFLDKYGFDNPNKNEIVKKKIIKTNNLKYGGNSPMCNELIQEKSKTTLLLNYGVDSPLKNKDILKKSEDKMLELYGVKYWIQDVDNLEKLIGRNGKSTYKKYVLNDKEIYLQGYEDYVLFEILLKKYKIDDICMNNKDIEKYTNKIYYEKDNRKHKYYPDFYIISENKIIEVKSDYTYNYDLNINEIKKKSCENMGIHFDFIIINRSTYKNWIKNKKHYEKF